MHHYYNNKIVAITGAGSGMGRSYAMLLSKIGARVVLSDIDAEELAQTVTLVEKITAKPCAHLVMDVSKQKDWQQFKALCQTTYQGCDVLINNAGIEGATVPVWASTVTQIKRTMDVNFMGVVYGTRTFLPLLVQSPHSHLINVSSIFGLIGSPNASDYCASKFAVKGYTEALMVELAHVHPHVGVHLVHPGGVDTNIARSQNTAKFKEKFLTTPCDEIVEHVLKQVAAKQPRIVYGNQANKTYWASRLLSLPRLVKMIGKSMVKIADKKDYDPQHKGFQ
jgi:butyryl-CoA dehydrogenase